MEDASKNTYLDCSGRFRLPRINLALYILLYQIQWPLGQCYDSGWNYFVNVFIWSFLPKDFFCFQLNLSRRRLIHRRSIYANCPRHHTPFPFCHRRCFRNIYLYLRASFAQSIEGKQNTETLTLAKSIPSITVSFPISWNLCCHVNFYCPRDNYLIIQYKIVCGGTFLIFYYISHNHNFISRDHA